MLDRGPRTVSLAIPSAEDAARGWTHLSDHWGLEAVIRLDGEAVPRAGPLLQDNAFRIPPRHTLEVSATEDATMGAEDSVEEPREDTPLVMAST